jgi:hypothetical protein
MRSGRRNGLGGWGGGGRHKVGGYDGRAAEGAVQELLKVGNDLIGREKLVQRVSWWPHSSEQNSQRRNGPYAVPPACNGQGL